MQKRRFWPPAIPRWRQRNWRGLANATLILSVLAMLFHVLLLLPSLREVVWECEWSILALLFGIISILGGPWE